MPLHLVRGTRSLFVLTRGFFFFFFLGGGGGVYVSGFGTCRLLLVVSRIHFLVSLLSEIKLLGLADQRAHACVCSVV